MRTSTTTSSSTSTSTWSRSQSLDELQAVHAEHQGVPLFNTIATGADGRVWYADTAATPNLSDEARATLLREAAHRSDHADRLRQRRRPARRFRQPIHLGGRHPAHATTGWFPSTRCRWSNAPTTCSTPTTASGRRATSSRLDGAFSILHGEQNTPLSMRTRQNAARPRGRQPNRSRRRRRQLLRNRIARRRVRQHRTHR